MKVLIATYQTQGSQPGDYCWTVEGELVTPVTAECSSPHLCGCGRGFPGLRSGRATTTALVADRPGTTRGQVRSAVRSSLERGGWLDQLRADEANEIVEEHLRCIDLVCETFAVGSVLGRRGTQMVLRRAACVAEHGRGRSTPASAASRRQARRQTASEQG